MSATSSVAPSPRQQFRSVNNKRQQNVYDDQVYQEPFVGFSANDDVIRMASPTSPVKGQQQQQPGGAAATLHLVRKGRKSLTFIIFLPKSIDLFFTILMILKLLEF